MLTRHRPTLSRAVALLCTAALLLFVSTTARADDDDPTITSVVPATAGPAGTLTITGVNLDPRGPLHVLLNGQALNPTSQTSTRIVVSIPPALLAVPGTYLLVVGHGRQHGSRDDDFATFDVTIGATGSVGASGP